MTKQEQIENMIGVMSASNNPFVDVPIEIMPQVAEALYNAGYRKIDEVRKETAKEVLQTIMDIIKKSDCFLSQEVVRILAKNRGVEVEE